MDRTTVLLLTPVGRNVTVGRFESIEVLVQSGLSNDGIEFTLIQRFLNTANSTLRANLCAMFSTASAYEETKVLPV